jgi:uncharacterized protein (TIGR03083 family)
MNRQDQLALLLGTSERMAAAAERDLRARVEHCPEWSVLDLVEHIAGVQWFWADIVERRVRTSDGIRRPGPVPDGVDVVSWFRTQTQRLHAALSAASDDDTVWTWWPEDQTVRFVLRRQVNEVVIHGFDAANATGADRSISDEAAVLGLEEFVEVISKDLRDGATSPQPIALAPSNSAWRGVLFPNAAWDPPIPLVAPVERLLLTLWNRAAPADARIAEAIAALDLS